MNICKIFSAVFILVIVYGKMLGQTPASILNTPQVIPPPADAASLGKYGDVPVSMNNGTPNIVVPIYTVKTPRLSLPIELNYNASGIKVDDRASWVGLEWSLNAGGVITRSIQGVDDFLNPGGYYYSTIPLAANVTYANNWKLFENVTRKTWDSEPDYFFFNFGSYTGKFFFGRDKKPVIVNYQQPLQVSYVPSTGIFTILDEKGNTYYFGSLETNGSGGSYNSGYTASNYTTSWYLSKIVSYDLSDTISFTYGTDPRLEEDFESYTETIGPYYNTLGTQIFQGHDYGTDEPFKVSYPLRLQEIDYKNGMTKFFSSKTRSDGAASKLDSVIVYYLDYSTKQYKEIKKVKPSYSYYTSNATVGVEPAICPGPNRLRLDSVRMYGADSVYAGAYKFAYDPNMLPWIAGNARDQFNYYNGATGNASTVPTQTVTFATTVYNVGAANRATNASYIQNGILKTITYPTGGYTNFTYEPNSYATPGSLVTIIGASANAYGVTHQLDTSTFVAPTSYQGTPLVYINISSYNYPGVPNPPFVKITDLTTGVIVINQALPDPNNGSHYCQIFFNWWSGHTFQCVAGAYGDGRISSQIYISYQQPSGTVTTSLGGGLRIKQITDFDYSNRFIKSDVYKYGTNESGYGTLSEPTNLFNTNAITSTFGYPSTTGGNSPGPYYTTTRVIYTGGTVYDAFSLSGPPVTYPQVSLYHVDSLNNDIGKSVYNYNFYYDNISAVSIAYQDGLYLASSGWQGGQLLQSQDFANKAGVYWPLKRTTYSYANPPLPQAGGLKIGYVNVYPYIPVMDSIGVSGGFFNVLYYWFDATLYAGSVLPASETSLEYDQNDSTKYSTKTTQWSYDNLVHLQPTRVYENESDGSTLLTINRYPAEMDSLSGLPLTEINAIDTLLNRHNLTPLLQKSVYLNNTLVNRYNYHYGLWNTRMALPSSIEVQNGNNASEIRMQFLQYDAYGNLQIVGKAGDAKKYYIWDYGNSLPVAEITNDPVGYSSYTGFEADGSGGFTLPDTTRVRTDAVTGNMSYNIANKTITQNLYVGHTYVVSYWAKPGPLTVKWKVVGFGAYTAVTATAGLTKNGWTYYEHILPTTAATVQLTSTTGLIDDLRIYPVGSLMKSYTYQPFAGITSASTENNLFTTYEYDGLARLKTIRDIDKNAIKVYDYQYQVSPHTFYNTGLLLNFTRNNCAICLVGSTVSYTVPAGMFSSLISQSDVQAQALAYGNVVGQAYANANGTCGAPAVGPITATNSTTSTIMVAFINNCTGTEYDFRLSTSTGTNWNTVPQGSYTVSIGGGTATTTYNVNGYTQSGTSASFGNIPIVSGYNYFQVH